MSEVKMEPTISSLYLEGDIGTGDATPQPEVVSEPEAVITPELAAARAEAATLKSTQDMILSLSKNQQGEPTASPPTEEMTAKMVADFEADPEAFINARVQEALENSPALKESAASVQEVKAHRALGELSEKVENFSDVLQEKGFQDFLAREPIFKKVLVAANESYDVDTVAGVLNHYLSSKEGEEVPAAGVETALNNSKKGLKTGSGRMLSRSALKTLSVENPAAYAKMDKEITQAYKEGRVK